MFTVSTIAILTAAIVATGVVSSCSSSSWHECLGRYWTDPTVRQFYGMRIETWETTFPNYDFEDQYRIYLYGNLCVHPPYMSLAGTFAREGTKVVAPLQQKLSLADDDGTIWFIIVVFGNMNDFRTYDVAGDEELMKVITESIQRMKSPVRKKSAEKMLEEIRK